MSFRESQTAHTHVQRITPIRFVLGEHLRTLTTAMPAQNRSPVRNSRYERTPKVFHMFRCVRAQRRTERRANTETCFGLVRQL